jgi:ligand-binding sensor domain-containing protein/signal transduction histidine kinase
LPFSKYSYNLAGQMTGSATSLKNDLTSSSRAAATCEISAADYDSQAQMRAWHNVDLASGLDGLRILEARIARPNRLSIPLLTVCEEGRMGVGKFSITCCSRWTAWLFSLLLMLCQVIKSEQLPVKIYTTADGLPRDSINRIVRDSHAFLWFCTEEGLSRFDGYKFTNYTTAQGLPGRQVLDLLETRDGVYWVATVEGLCRFNPDGFPPAQGNATRNKGDAAANPIFVVYSSDEAEATGDISVLFEDHTGTVWLGTSAGLFRLEQSGEQIKFHFVDLGMPAHTVEDRHVLAIVEDRQGALWVGAQSSGLYRYWADGRVEHYTVRDGLPSDDVHSLLVDREGHVWAGTIIGLCELVSDPQPNRPVVAHLFTEKDGIAVGWIYSLFQSSDGRLWAASNGLSEFVSAASGNGQSFRSYTKANGVGGAGVWALAEDLDGNLWLGTKNGGAMKLARNGFTTFGPGDGLPETGANSVFEDHAGYLCAISKGQSISRLDENRFVTIRPRYPANITAFGWGWNQVGLQARTGEWWLPTAQGLCRFPKVGRFEQLARRPPKAVYTVRDGLVSNDVFRIFEDSRGDVWISTISSVNSGVTRWERATETMHGYSKNPEFIAANLSSILVTSFTEDGAGNVWIGHSAGLIRYAAGHFWFFTKADGVPDGWIRAIYLDHNHRLWIASGKGGLSRIDDPQEAHPHFITYTTAEGLSSDEVDCVTEDQWGRVYAGTGRGVDRLDPATGYIKHYTAADGLISGFVLSAFRDRQGALWFCSEKGLSRFVPEPDLHQTPPPILINGLKIAGDSQHISALGQTEISIPELAPDRNQIQIEFVGLSFSAGETLRYQYKLEGAVKDWGEPTSERTVNYASLRPGAYRFLVRAVTSDGVVSETPAEVAFRILPPFWQSWWFLTLTALFIGLAIFAAYHYRVARLVELERVRTRIASDLHDDIGSNLSVIAGLSDVLRREAVGASSPGDARLSLIAAVSQRSLEAINDIVWAVNPKKDHFQDLTQRLRLFADEAFFAQNIEFWFSAPESAGDTRIGAETRREVFLIFKEAVNNIVRHSHCSKAEATLHIDHKTLVLQVSDDGVGFDPERAHAGEGLASMRRRAEKIGGEIEVVSNTRLGATIRLRAPLG